MGGFYGSIHLRTDDRNAVRSVLEAVASVCECKFFLAPPIRGWTSLYPALHGQSDRVSKEIAKRLTCDIFHLIVHDSDVFSYWCFRAGQEVDRYDSNPDYFGRVRLFRQRKLARLRGRPETYRHLLGNEDRLQQLIRLLREPGEERSLVADDQLVRFAELLDIPNALTSYEYLDQGETDGIQRWEQFFHVPDRSAEIAHKEAEQQASVAQKQRLQAEGVLLYEQTAPSGPPGQWGHPYWCHDPLEGGFFVSFLNVGRVEPSPVERYAAPWRTGPSPTGISIESTIAALTTSPSGKYLAAQAAGAVRLWNPRSMQPIGEVSPSRMVGWLQFSPDETQLICATPQKITVTSLVDLRTVATMDSPVMAMGAALHPSGSMLVLNGRDKLALLDLTSTRPTSVLCLGRKLNPSWFDRRTMRRMQREVAKTDTAAIEKMMRKTFEKLGMDPKLAEEQLQEAMRQRRQALELASSPQWQQSQVVRGTEQAIRLLFSADGRLLCCATVTGVRVFAWDQLLAAREETPRPRFATGEETLSRGIFRVAPNYQNCVYDLALDADRNRLLFAGLNAKVQFMDLSNGRTGTLLDEPEGPAVIGLGVAPDRSSLLCARHHVMQNRPCPAWIQIWNYPALCAAAGLD